MNIKVLAALVAGLALLSAVGCSGSSDTNEGETESQTFSYNSGWVEPGTGGTLDGTGTSQITNPGYNTPYEEKEKETLEANAQFTEISMTLYVVAENGKVRKEATTLSDSNVLDYVVEGDTLQATGESQAWYRIKRGEKTAYISKKLVCEKSILDGFTAVNETVVLSEGANVRCMPSSANDDYAWRGVLKKGDSVVRTGVSESGWSRVKFTYEGKEKEYFIRTECIAETAETATQAK